MKDAFCACGSGKTVNCCCQPLINGEIKALSAEQLMRSRYVAYTRLNHDYILHSWHSRTRPAVINLDKEVCWTGLKILSVLPAKQSGAEAFVEFVADFVSHGKPGHMHEKSRFLQEQGEWRYVDGLQFDTGLSGQTPKLPGRNDPCYCGSGKKFKKCCMANS